MTESAPRNAAGVKMRERWPIRSMIRSLVRMVEMVRFSHDARDLGNDFSHSHHPIRVTEPASTMGGSGPFSLGVMEENTLKLGSMGLNPSRHREEEALPGQEEKHTRPDEKHPLL